MINVWALLPSHLCGEGRGQRCGDHTAVLGAG